MNEFIGLYMIGFICISIIGFIDEWSKCPDGDILSMFMVSLFCWWGIGVVLFIYIIFVRYHGKVLNISFKRGIYLKTK
jgi:hypothetical protein